MSKEIFSRWQDPTIKQIQQENQELKERIDKAIEHIKDKTKTIPLEDGGGLELSDYDITELLEILRGDSNE